MGAVAQANCIDETQLSNGNRKQQKKLWKFERISNLKRELEERAQLNENELQDDTFGLDDFRDNLSMAKTQLCSLNKTTTASWRNGATLYKKMLNQYASFDKLEVSDDHLEPDGNPIAKKLRFSGERSSGTFNKQKRKRNSTALQLLGENTVVATEN